MSRIFWDSMLWIYFFEASPRFGLRTRQIFLHAKERGDLLLTSTLAVGEALVGPRKSKSNNAAATMQAVFSSELVEVLPFTIGAASLFADIRASYRISTPDAINLACAAAARTDVFITNDTSLVGKTVPGIQFIVGLNTDLF